MEKGKRRRLHACHRFNGNGAGATGVTITGAERGEESGTAGEAGMEGAWPAAARPRRMSSETVTSS